MRSRHGFGSGDNKTASDGSASSTGNAVLYIVAIETGGIIKKFDTKQRSADDPQGNSRPSGLGSPAPVDVTATASSSASMRATCLAISANPTSPATIRATGRSSAPAVGPARSRC